MRWSLLLACVLCVGCTEDPMNHIIIDSTVTNEEADIGFPIDSTWIDPDPVVSVDAGKPSEPISQPAPTPPRTKPALRMVVKPQLKATVYVTDNCDPCKKLEAKYGSGNERIAIEYKKERPKNGPFDGYPAVRWVDSAGVIRWPVDLQTGRQSIPDTLDQLADLIEKNNKPKPKQSRSFYQPNTGIKFGFESWTESATGRTSIRHLMQEHGLSYAQIAPYANNPQALNLIHGWRHTGRGYNPTPVMQQPTLVQSSDPLGLMLVPAVAEVGYVEGASDWMSSGLLFWSEKIGEDIPTTIIWDRSGAQEESMFHLNKVSLVQLVGELGSIRVSAPGSKLPVDEAELGYRHLGNGVWRLTGSADIQFDENNPLPMSSQDKVKFADPLTILSIISGAKTVWDLLHPKIDITIPPRMAMVCNLKDGMFAIDFQKGPEVHASWLILNFDLGVKRVEATEKKVRVLFKGSNWIKERTFKLTSTSISVPLLAMAA